MFDLQNASRSIPPCTFLHVVQHMLLQVFVLFVRRLYTNRIVTLSDQTNYVSEFMPQAIADQYDVLSHSFCY